MALTLSVAPAAEPVTTAEAKAHLRVDGADDDSYIAALVAAAREYCEGMQRRAYVTQTWTLTLDGFPAGGRTYIDIPLPPLQSVSSITYLDSTGDSQTWASSNYTVDAKGTPGRVALAPDAVWPTTQAGRINAVTITFVAGYGLAADVPESMKQAIYLLVGDWYGNREAQVVGTVTQRLSFSVGALLGLDRVYTL